MSSAAGGDDDQGAYDQKDAAGFIKINALRLCLLVMREKRRMGGAGAPVP